jgi:hypothetical protein
MIWFKEEVCHVEPLETYINTIWKLFFKKG